MGGDKRVGLGLWLIVYLLIADCFDN